MPKRKLQVDRIYNMDCVEGMKLLPDNSVDLVVTSPPYNISVDYDAYVDNLTWDSYFEWCSSWLNECYRVLKDDGRIIINHYMSLGTSKCRVMPLSEISCIMHKIGFKHHTLVTWEDITLVKRTAWGSYMSASAPYINAPFEGLLIEYKTNWKKLKRGESTIDKDTFISLTRGIWKIKTETHGLTKANFSLDLPIKCLDLLSYKGDVVLDPFMGSGTTAVAAKLKGRHFIGFEISATYCDIARKRLLETQKD